MRKEKKNGMKRRSIYVSKRAEWMDGWMDRWTDGSMIVCYVITTKHYYIDMHDRIKCRPDVCAHTFIVKL